MGTSAVLGPLSALKDSLGLPFPCLGLTAVEQGIHTGQNRLCLISAQLPRHGRLPAVFSLVWALI